jgi:hypothetical protein
MHSTTEDVEDGEQISCEFRFGAMTFMVENHEFSTVLLDKVLYDFNAESGESIPMGNHNLEFIALVKSVQ